MAGKMAMKAARAKPVRGANVALLLAADGWRGSGTSFAKIARGLETHGHRVQVVVAHERVARAFAKEGIAPTLLPMPATGLSVAWRLRRALVARPHVLIADGPRELRLAALATLSWPTRLVFRYNLLFGGLADDLASRLFWTRMHGLVFQSELVRARALAESPWLAARPSVRIANGYDLDRFRPDDGARARVRERFGIPSDRLLVVTGGKPARGKGHEVAVAALAQAAREAPAFSWLVLGDGIRLEETRTLAATAGLDAHFTGFVRPPVVAEALAAADLVLQPAAAEIFPNAVAEAMASGRAVVASAAGGTAELTGEDGRAARLVPVGDVSAMAAAVAGLLADPAARTAMGVAARARIAAEFPLERMAAGYDAFVRRLAGLD